jgi:2-C-methyl-D-erythritol 4-phosphate cytidylyltransferase/2-C-methyl-D-erythritol 2,4-cyclodiphosphate synthase
MGAGPRKQFLLLGGRPLLLSSLDALASWPGLDGLVVVAPADDVERVRGLVEGAGIPKVLRVVAGGTERQDSVRLGLEALAEAADADVVFVHDGVRPFPPVHRFSELREAAEPDGALLALTCRDTLKRSDEGRVAATVDRSGLWQAQTPQAFPVGLLREALAWAGARGAQGTDEASLVEALGRRPRLVAGDPRNLKVTTPEDLPLAEALAAAPVSRCPRREGEAGQRGPGAARHVGHGYDVHRLVEGRRLVLGGVAFDHPLGLLGHSDADVLAHAVADACLGAAGLGDLGRHFPDTDPRWAGVSSLDLLTRVSELVADRGLTVLRVDATLIAERPKIAPYAAAMEANLSRALGLPAGGVSVKATSTEGLGFEGRQEGMSAHAVALLAE